MSRWQARFLDRPGIIAKSSNEIAKGSRLDNQITEAVVKGQKVALIQSSFLGDCILTLPLIFRLMETVGPSGSLDLVATGAGFELFDLALKRGLKAYQGQISLQAFNKKKEEKNLRGLINFARKLEQKLPKKLPKKLQIGTFFCVQRSFRSGLLAWLSQAEHRVGFSSGAASFFYTHAVRRDWDGGRSEIEKNLDLLRAVHPWVPAWNPSEAPSLLASSVSPNEKKRSDPVVALSIGSNWGTKQWNLENAVLLTKKLVDQGVDVKILGDATSRVLGETIRQKVPSLLVKDLSGKTTIEEWVDEIASSSVLVSADSAAVHAASDLKVPVLALFGPTVPDFGFAPWRRNSLALGVTNLSCRPCDIHGPKTCPLVHHDCMKKLSADSVFQQVKRLAGNLGLY